jgi:membrane protein DedA with SNARE-associated domain
MRRVVLMVLGIVLCVVGGFLLLGAVITAGISASTGYSGGDSLVENPWFGMLASMVTVVIGVILIATGALSRPGRRS